MKIEIEVPNPPEGLEIVGYVYPKAGDHILSPCGDWSKTAQFDFQTDKCITARKKRTLADWANEQELFKALAKMAGNTSVVLDPGQVSKNGWYLNINPDRGPIWAVHLGEIPGGLPHAKLKLANGKWELA